MLNHYVLLYPFGNVFMRIYSWIGKKTTTERSKRSLATDQANGRCCLCYKWYGQPSGTFPSARMFRSVYFIKDKLYHENIIALPICSHQLLHIGVILCLKQGLLVRSQSLIKRINLLLGAFERLNFSFTKPLKYYPLCACFQFAIKQ